MYPYAVKMNGKYYKPNEEIPEAAVEASDKPVETSDGTSEENITGTPKRAKKTVKKASE